jgi:hypothetical protein
MFWFVSPPFGIISITAYWLLSYLPLQGWLAKSAFMAALYLLIFLIVLTCSGYTAWSKEFAKTQDKWPRLGLSAREAIIEQLLPFNVAPEPLITAHDCDDCCALGVDLCAVIGDATKGRFRPYLNKSDMVPSGIVIAIRQNDQRGIALKKALASVAGIEAELRETELTAFAINIGART